VREPQGHPAAVARGRPTGAGRRKRQRLGTSTWPADRLAAEHPDHVWALDYQFDQTQDGRRLKLLNVVDEHTREALAIVVERRIDADATVGVLDQLMANRGRPPRFIRCDIHSEWRADGACGVRPAA
jgi:putative transposase